MDVAPLGLYELNESVSDCLSQQFADPLWVVAEVISLSENRTGHCYLELIEKQEDGAIIARAKATIWASLYRQIKPYFIQATGTPSFKLSVNGFHFVNPEF